MKKITILLLMTMMILVVGCMASFPAKYDPKFALDPQFGKQSKINTTVKFENAFGKEVTEESLKLQLLTDKKFENWGFVKDKMAEVDSMLDHLINDLKNQQIVSNQHLKA